MKLILAVLTLSAISMAMPTNDGHPGHPKDSPTVCESHQTVVCNGGNGGLLSLGNLLTGLLGESCSGGDVYCCSQSDVDQTGLINLDLNLQCSLNHLL
ncbi:hypothetical protein N7468_004904 [Penicillium chermesinum]|uniref:Hydrophobin n=1 Tax=Penicillium chermesinum TaxID=63820 RepID=A0A9W9P9L9_9EURO|nr:uncharacterized protein N7468_004904 [Penicillium chermesinum]KAJ5240285.1 hypothetical protein N7468_004904 [Penicillium chermesinum]KAJ6167153.1 hypothetical protein N7470_002600 [Penicillium chermesinum]